jgi:hypothetical protein
VTAVAPLLGALDVLLVLGVNPGWNARGVLAAARGSR